jgi:phosphatidylserine/phosphatidylglycerophosphate/cardiolipin synthase-like enzyme
VPATHQSDVDDLCRAWLREGSATGPAIALALQAARRAIAASDAPKVEVVVTGPDSPAVPIRLTSEVVAGLIVQARQRVTIVSYSVGPIPRVIEALSAALTRQVRVTLVFESPDHFSNGGALAYKQFPIYTWADELRPKPGALMHSKAVIVDSRDILVTSANLSNMAHESSLETGVLCRGGGTAARMQQHFDALIAQGVLQQIT